MRFQGGKVIHSTVVLLAGYQLRGTGTPVPVLGVRLQNTNIRPPTKVSHKIDISERELPVVPVVTENAIKN